jgi:hypothetical protein
LTDRRQQSSVIDVLSFRRAGCDNDHYLVVVKLWYRWAEQRICMEGTLEGFNLKNLNEGEDKKINNKQREFTISNKFRVLDTLEGNGDMSRGIERS